MSEEQQEAALEEAATQDVPETPEGDQAEPQEDQSQEAQGEAPEGETRTQARRRRREAKAREVNERLDAARKAAEAAEKAAQYDAPTPPKEGDFETLEAYQAALTAHHLSDTLGQRDAARARQEADKAKAEVEAAEKAKAAEVAAGFAAQAAEARKKHADFDAVVGNPNLAITPGMAEMIATGDNGGDVAYHLGKNPELSAQIAQMDSIAQAREMARLEMMLSAPQAKTTSAAPPPITPVTSEAGPSGYAKGMTPREYRAWRAAGGTH